MTTKLKYLKDTYLFEDKAKVVSIDNDDKGKFIILDETIFHPQGGGQASDIGIIKKNDINIEIHFVAFANGSVLHYTNDFCNLKVGDEVTLFVNKAIRIQNSKYHTAGHLFSSITENILGNIIAVKGYHFAKGAHVEFDGPIDIEKKEIIIEQINNQLEKELNSGLNIICENITYEELQKRSNHIPEWVPKEKTIRVPQIAQYEPYPCGGTHIKNLSEFEYIKITKIKNKKRKAKISYTCG